MYLIRLQNNCGNHYILEGEEHEWKDIPLTLAAYKSRFRLGDLGDFPKSNCSKHCKTATIFILQFPYINTMECSS